MSTHDRRLHAFRPDLADVRLRDSVEAMRFVAGRPARIVVPCAAMRGAPDAAASQVSQLLLGDDVLVFDEAAGFAWVQAERDSYVGYVAADAIGGRGSQATHCVAVPRTFLYPGADLKLPHAGVLPMGAAVAITGTAVTRGTDYSLLADGGAVVSSHLRPAHEHAADFVAVAETFLHTPYLWGGTSGLGIDCSGLVQTAMRMAGRHVLRDTDMQAGTIGEPVEPGPGLSGLRRGDLVFWKGHVAIMTDANSTIHANGHTMMVSREPLAAAVERIAYLYGPPSGFRRV